MKTKKRKKSAEEILSPDEGSKTEGRVKNHPDKVVEFLQRVCKTHKLSPSEAKKALTEKDPKHRTLRDQRRQVGIDKSEFTDSVVNQVKALLGKGAPADPDDDEIPTERVHKKGAKKKSSKKGNKPAVLSNGNGHAMTQFKLVFGKYSVSSVLRAMGRKGWSRGQARMALQGLGYKVGSEEGMVKPKNIDTQIHFGHKVDCNVISLSKKEWDELTAARKKMEAKAGK